MFNQVVDVNICIQKKKCNLYFILHTVYMIMIIKKHRKQVKIRMERGFFGQKSSGGHSAV